VESSPQVLQVSVGMNAATTSAAPWTLYSGAQRWGLLTILFVVITTSYFDCFVISVLLEPIKQEFHVSDTMLGLLSGLCFSLLYSVVALPVARWVDRGNRRTVIALGLTAWSAMTVFCGMAGSFSQLALARLGVGATESGAMPAAQSLVVDYFPVEQRATALATLTTAAVSVGYLLAICLGGLITAAYGWRAAFILVGAPGLLLALIARLALAEPRCQLGFPRALTQRESTRQTLVRLGAKKSFRYMLVALSLYALFGYGVTTFFLPSYMMRILHASLTQVSQTWGFSIASANVIGALVGGRLTDRLIKRDVRWHMWLPAIACILGGLVYWVALSLQHFWPFLIVEFLAETIMAIGVPAAFAAVHTVCGERRRAMAVAIVYFLITLCGAGLGPLAVGMLSDLLGTVYGHESLRYSLIAMLLILIPAAAAFYWSGRWMPHELES
jgi:MFS family permease